MGYEYLLGIFFCFRKLLDFMTLWPFGHIILTYHNIFLPRAISYQRIFFDPQLSGFGDRKREVDPFGLNFEHVDPWVLVGVKTGIKKYWTSQVSTSKVFGPLSHVFNCFMFPSTSTSDLNDVRATKRMVLPQKAFLSLFQQQKIAYQFVVPRFVFVNFDCLLVPFFFWPPGCFGDLGTHGKNIVPEGNIKTLSERVIELTEYRASLSEYLKVELDLVGWGWGWMGVGQVGWIWGLVWVWLALDWVTVVWNWSGHACQFV